MAVVSGRGTGGSTSSCTVRGAEANSAAKSDGRAAPSMVVVDGGADPYFVLHSAAVCDDVEPICWMRRVELRPMTPVVTALV
jgi:hypothetical protein